MLTCPDAPDLFLLEISDMAAFPDAPREAQRWPSAAREALPAAAAVLDWARSYLSQPHADLGRPGPVCPYVPASLRDHRFWITAQPGRHPAPADVVAAVRRVRDWFPSLEPRSGPEAALKTVLVLFPDTATADAPALIDATQAALKPEFVRAGLMLGQFHPAPPAEPGLWNPDFRPLRSPVPLLAIRHMVASDLPFLTGSPGFLQVYLDHFGDSVPERCRVRLADALAEHGLPDDASADEAAA